MCFCQDDNYWAIKREKTAEELAAEAAAAAKKKEEEEQKKAEETVRTHHPHNSQDVFRIGHSV